MVTKASLGVVDDAVRARANHTGTQAIATVTGLQAALDAKGAAPVEGDWMPTLTATANVSGTPSGEFHYIRIGNTVRCWGFIVIDPVAASNTNTALRMTIPIPSNFTTSGDLRGLIATTGAQRSGIVYSDAANDAALITYASETTAETTFSFNFDYRVK